MAKRKQEHHEEEHENHERWLLTYADMITLLLGLFIMLYAMSNIDSNKYKQVAIAMSSAFGSGGGANKIIEETSSGSQLINDFPMPASPKSDTSSNKNNNKSGTGMTEAQRMEDLAGKINKYIKEKHLESQIGVLNQERGVVITVKSSYFFATGSAKISENTRKNIDDIGKYLKSLNNYVSIEGHTDNVPIKSEDYDNWDLSSDRAKSVMEVLLKDLNFNPARLSHTGYGEVRPVVPNNSAANRARNRRVEIVVFKSDYNKVVAGR